MGFRIRFVQYVASGRPFLGICLGLQLLFDVSFEDGEYAGLGIVPGQVVRFESQPGLKIPHMGWNSLRIVQPAPLLANLPQDPQVYFVHSYHVVPKDLSFIAATSNHGGSLWRRFSGESVRDAVPSGEESAGGSAVVEELCDSLSSKPAS